MNEYEKKIKEQRTSQAIAKDLMGFDGKIGCIVRNMGQQIIAQGQGGAYFNSSPGYDFEALPEDEPPPGELFPGSPEEICRQMPVMGVEGCEEPQDEFWMPRREPTFESVEEIGWYFSGLSRGMHLEIKYTNENKELIVRHKGKLVFKEIAGDLDGYVPSPEWERMIDRLHVIARKMQSTRNKTEKEAKKQILRDKKQGWLDRMKSKWGF